MNEPENKPLHDWVRRSLDDYRPAYELTDWVRMQRLLRRRRWWRGGLIGVLGLVLLSWLGWRLIMPSAIKPRAEKHPLIKLKQPHSADAPYFSSSHRSIIKASEQTAPERRKPDERAEHQHSELQRPPAPSMAISLTELKPLSTNLSFQISHPNRVAFSSEEPAITQQMLTGEFGSDSTSYRALDRNLNQWPDAVIVCDLTTSMYPYTTQLFAWIKQHISNPTLKGMVFFTDCDSLGQQTHTGGPPGRMYITHERNADHVLPVLLEAARNTVRNDDDAENDVEALLFAQQTFPEAKHVILLADNLSMVKDMALLSQVMRPVHVVLCGTTGGHLDLAFQPDYYRIASQTRGSLHTLEDDLNPGEISSKTTLRVGANYYRYMAHRKKFRRTDFDHRPKRFLGFIWL
jgi:hypothetical protein